MCSIDLMNGMKNRLSTLLKTGFFHVFGSSVINRIILFLSNIILVRILSKTEYGVFSYAWNLYSLLALFNGMGMDSAVLQLSSEKNQDQVYRKSILRYGMHYGLRFNVLLAGAILCTGFLAPLKIESGRGLLIALCTLPAFQLMFSLATNYLRSGKMNKEFAKLNTTNTITLFISSVLFVLLLKEKGIVLSYYITAIVSVGIGVFYFKIPFIGGYEALPAKDTLLLKKIAIISMCNNALSHLLYLLDIFVIGIVDPQETIIASYKVATTIPTALTFVPLAVLTYAYPYFAEHKDDKEWCFTKYKSLLLSNMLLNGGISFVLFIFAPLIIQMLYGTQYLDCVPIFRVLAINFFISGSFRIVSGNLLVTQRKLKFNLLVSIIASCANIIADYYFIQKWGSMGAAYATVLVVLISSIMTTTYLVYVLKSQENTSPI